MKKTGWVFIFISMIAGSLLVQPEIHSQEKTKQGKCVEGDCKNGYGVFLYSDSSRYEGLWKDGKREGTGKVTISSKDQDQIIGGMFIDDMPHGKILWTVKNKDGSEEKYEGGLVNWKFHGHGTFVYRNGDTYEGEWKNDKRSGNGTLVKKDGGTYIGEWGNDSPNGKGKYIDKNGNTYDGNFRNGKRNGIGRQSFIDGTIYIGDFKNGEITGIGNMNFPSNDKYEGEFLRAEYNGKGTYYYSNGQKYIGFWKGGKEHGQGILYDAEDNIVAQGNWVEGVLSNPLNLALKDAEEITREFCLAYMLDVFGYYKISETYDTELKRATFKQSKEYREKYQTLLNLKRSGANKWYYSIVENPFQKNPDNQGNRDYNVKLQGFRIDLYEIIIPSFGGLTPRAGDMPLLVQTEGEEDGTSYRDRIITIDNPGITDCVWIYFNPFPSMRKDMDWGDPNYRRGVVFLPMSPSQGLKIENDRDNCVIYFVYKLTGFSEKEMVFYANPVRVIVANKESGDVYYDRTFYAGK